MIRGSSMISKLNKCRVTQLRLQSTKTTSSATKYTTLSNGITIASESNPQAKHSSIGLYIGGGSRTEHPYNNGISALTTDLLSNHSTQDGILISSKNDKEFNGILAETTNDNIKNAGKLLSSIVSNAEEIITKSDLSLYKKFLTQQVKYLESNPKSKVLSHLEATAYQGYSLGLPTLGTPESIENLQVEDSLRHLNNNLNNNNIVIAGSGNFSHEELVESIESSNLKIKESIKPEIKPVSFLGSEVRMRDDTLPKAYFAIAVNGEGINSPNYYIAQVAAKIFGNYDSNSTIKHYTSPKLASIVQEYDIVDSYEHFSKSFSDSGLWGYYCEISNKFTIDDFAHFSLKQWNRLSISISEAEVVRAKNQLKTEILTKLSTSNEITNDIGSKILLNGYRNSIRESFEKIDSIKLNDVKEWGKSKVWDRDIVISATGQIEDLFDYNRNRNEMAMMRW
ncbi:unnamed protein product [Candida verbasci]|uniref:Uncharacterized protein n=1 Tax=Candida verbasci TaxID=1227364 RepID=A0A9W4TZA5_9ASCO|nr:unnamed protein product [Candida verbasci]